MADGNSGTGGLRCVVFAALLALVAASPSLSGQEVAEDRTATRSTTDDPLSAAALEATITWLADDARGGRDTPSAGLEETGDWIAARFSRAGLEPCGEDHFHRFVLPGRRFDAADVKATYRGGALKGGEDVRVLTTDRELKREKVDLDGREGALAVVEVETDSPLWRAAEGVVERLERDAGRVVVLIRKGALPEGVRDLEITAPAPRPAEVALRNVVGILRGSERPDEIVMISAHHDHVGLGLPQDGDAVFNGADDDATGVAAVVQLAEAFAAAGSRPARSIAFVCFAAEEKGLLGSAAFVRRPPFPLESIVCDLNLEMLGRPADAEQVGQAWITGPGYSDLADIVTPALEKAGVVVRPERMATALFRQSDNWSLAKAGVVAHSLSAGHLHADYHGRNDEVDRIDCAHVARIVRGLKAALEHLAGSTVRPTWTAGGKRVIESAARRER